MAGDKTIKLTLVGEDKSASKALKGVGDEAEATGGRLARMGEVAGGVLTADMLKAAGEAVVQFGKDSVAAFMDAEKSQRELEDAYGRFPAVASVSIDALRELNSAIQAKTGADADDLASSQAVLAQYGLTGEQIAQLTPLLDDYAVKTGKDLPAAAEDLGKSMLGQGRALKSVGIDFKDAGSVAGNFDQVVSGLRTQVGGFAESEASSAEGALRRLTTEFGDVQEEVGAQLLPVLLQLGEGLLSVVGWVKEAMPALEGFSGWIGALPEKFEAAKGHFEDHAGWYGALAAVITTVAMPPLVVWVATSIAGWISTAAQAVASGATTAAIWVMLAADAAKSAAAQWLAHVQTIGGWILSAGQAVASGATTAAIWLMLQWDAAASAAAQVLAHVQVAGAWVLSAGQAVASGAVAAGVWLAAKAEAVGSAVVQVAQLGLVGAAWASHGIAVAASTVATGAATAAQWLLNAALSANPIGIVVLLIAGLVAAFVWAYENVEWFRAGVDSALNWVKDAAGAVVDWFNGDFLSFWGGVFTSAGETFDGWSAGIDGTLQGVQGFFDEAGRGIDQWGQDVAGFFDGVRAAGEEKFGLLKDGALVAFDGLKTGFGLWSSAFGKLLHGDFDGFRTDTEALANLMKDGILSVFNGIKDGAKLIWDMLPEDIKSPIRGAVQWINETFVKGINGFLGSLNISFTLPEITGFASGGYTGAGGKYQPAGIVHAGEVVWSQDDVAAWGGPSAVDAMRTLRGFATGGIVPNATQGLAGYDPAALAAIQAWAAATGKTWTMTGIGGARDYATQLAAYQKYLAGTGPLAANPATGGPHMVPAIAMDLSPRPGEDAAAKALLAQFGLGLTVAGEPWHVGYLAGRGGGITAGGPVDFGIGAFVEDLLSKMPSIASPWGDVAKAALTKIPDALISKVQDFFGSIAASVTGGGAAPAAGSVKAMAQQMAAARGWTGAQWTALDWIVGKESSWNPNAQNPTSTAYGLFQFLNSTWSSVGATKTSDPSAQISAGLQYIAQRYGTPTAAQAFWQANGWYDSGGWAMPGYTGLMNGTGKPEAVLTNDQWEVMSRAASSPGIDYDRLEAVMERAVRRGSDGARMKLDTKAALDEWDAEIVGALRGVGV